MAVDASALRKAPAPFREKGEAMRGAGWARAAASGLSGIALALLPLFAIQSIGQHNFGIPPASAYPLEESAWHEAPPGMPPGGRFAVISGDPFQDGPFVMRVRLPPGYVLPPYRRHNEEQMIVLAGAITVGTYGKSAEIRHAHADRRCVHIVAGQRAAFCHTRDGAIVQIFGIGPFAIEYINHSS